MRGRDRCRTRGSARAGFSRNAYALSSFDASTALGTASGAGVAGDATNGVSALVLFYLTALPSGTQTLAQRQAVTSGWLIRSIGTSLRCLAGNGAATAEAPTTTLAAGHLGKLHLVACSSDAAAVYQYLDNAQVGTSTALAGYAAASSRTMMGSTTSGANPATGYHILGVVGRDSHLALADFQTICAATKAANSGRIALGGISMDHQWNAPASATVPATVTDDIAADDMTFVVGSEANLVSSQVPIVWGW